MPWHGGQHEGDFPSLGWDLIDLAESTLRVPSGPMTGQPLTLEDWQAELVVRFYALNPRSGRFVYERAFLEAVKGSGKSPLGAVLAFGELVGPVVFDGWDANGEPVGRPRPAPLIQFAAVAEDQTENCYGAFRQMLGDSPAIAEFGIDLGLTRVYLTGRPGKAEPVTAAAGTREGQPVTFFVADEPWLWTPQNGGKKLAATLRRNAVKMRGRWAELTNAFEPGVGSVAEETAKAAEKDRSILVVRWEAPPVEDVRDEGQLRPAICKVYEPCPWVDVDSVVSYCLAPDTDPIEVRRFFLNHRVAAEARMVPEDVLQARIMPAEELPEGTAIAVGFDGSERRDATSIIGVRMDTGRAFVLGHWERQLHHPREWEVPRHEVVATLEAVFDRWTVARFKFDPSKWRDEMSLLAQAHGKDVVDRFPIAQTSVVDMAIESVQEGFRAGTLTVDGGDDSAALVAHLQAAMLTYLQTRGSRRLRNLAKPDDGRKIDAAAALVYAWQAKTEAQERGWKPKAAVAPFVLMR